VEGSDHRVIVRIILVYTWRNWGKTAINLHYLKHIWYNTNSRYVVYINMLHKKCKKFCNVISEPPSQTFRKSVILDCSLLVTVFLLLFYLRSHGKNKLYFCKDFMTTYLFSKLYTSADENWRPWRTPILCTSTIFWHVNEQRVTGAEGKL
jgi:hypothetical protein